MSAFADLLLVRFQQPAVVQALLADLGPTTLFELTYAVPGLDVKDVAVAGPPAVEFARPAFETRRTTGTDERIMPPADRVRVDRARPRGGRLEWVDAFLDVPLRVTAGSKATPLQSITGESLLTKLGPVATLADLRAKLAALYPPSVVEAFLAAQRYASVEEFRRRPGVFLEFVAAAPPPFDPADPATVREFRANVCVLFEPELKIGAALRKAKLCRGILENERDVLADTDDREVLTPFVFAALFPDATAVDGAIPGLTAGDIKAGAKAAFRAERMLAHFVT